MAAKFMTPSETLFESAPCGRCGGCGNYSYCQMYGTTCFGCNGQGVKLTKRGFAASNYYRSLFMVPVESIAIGDTVKDTAGKRFVVTAIKPGSVWLKSVDAAGNEQNLSAYPEMTVTREDGTTAVLSDVKAGDSIHFGRYNVATAGAFKADGAARRVSSVTHLIRLEGKNYSMDAQPDGLVFKCLPADGVAAMKAKALAYQASLTKTGKISTRAKAKAHLAATTA